MTLLSHRRQISAGHQDPLTTLLRSMATVSFISFFPSYPRVLPAPIFCSPTFSLFPAHMRLFLYPCTLYSPDFTRPFFVPYYYIETYVSY